VVVTSPWAQVAPDMSAPPSGVLAPVQLPDSNAMPQVFAPTPNAGGVDLHAGLAPIFPPSPKVVLDPNPQHQVEGAFANGNASEGMRLHDQNKLVKDYQKDADPYGSPDNHPGFFGKLAHALSHATGGDTRRGWEEQGLVKQINAQTADDSTNGYRNAETGKTQEETAEMPGKTQSEEGLQGAQSANLESETAERDANAAMGPTLIMGHAHAVNQAIKAGLDPATVPLVQQYEDAIQRLQPQKTPAEQGVGRTTDITTPQGIRTMGYDPKTGKYDIDNGPTGYRPPVTRVETPTEERGQRNDLLKAYQPTLDSAERMNVMTESYEKAIKDHDQQAMLNLLANHLGMTMGLQKGARMTKDIINEAKQSQPWLAGMESKFDKDGYLSGVTLSPNQMRQMVSLGQERYAEDAKKSRATAQYLGAKDDGPERVPGKATINFYLGQANGDPAKAKQLAAQDGWTQ
jgi:hypothetical protein